MKDRAKTRFSASLGRAIPGIVFLLFSTPALAQKTIYNVPFAEIVKKNKLFAQEQLDYAEHLLRSGTTVTYGLGRGFEIGVNLFDVAYSTAKGEAGFERSTGGESQTVPDLLVNAQKDFVLSEAVLVAGGTRVGVSLPAGDHASQFAGYYYLNSQYTIAKSLSKFVGGVLYATPAYSGGGNHVAAMAGVELSLLPQTLAIQAEFITGSNDLSGITSGLEVYLGAFDITAGVQAPWFGSANPVSGTLQISWDLE